MTQLLRERWALVLSIVSFSAVWLLLSQTIGPWSEAVSVYPSPPSPILDYASDTNPAPQFEPSCADPGPVRIVSSNVRPQVALCVGDRQYPIQVMSYASGVPYWLFDIFWPLHRGRVYAVHTSGLLLGIITLIVTRRLLVRLADRITADAAIICLSVAPLFGFLHSTLIHYETMPWFALLLALHCVTPEPGGGVGNATPARAPSTLNHVAAAALVALSLATNIKAVFFLIPLALFLARADLLGGLRPGPRWLIAWFVFALVLLPSVVGNLMDRYGDFLIQIEYRLRVLRENLNPQWIALDFGKLVLFAGDTMAFGSVISGKELSGILPGVVVGAASVTYCMGVAVLFWAGGRAPSVAAAVGSVFATFFLASTFFYDHPVSGYAPLSGLFGVAAGVTATDLGRAMARRTGWREGRAVGVGVALFASLLAWSTFGRGSAANFLEMSTNSEAMTGLIAHIEGTPKPSVPIFVTNEDMSGVIEAITGGEIRTIRAHQFLDCTPQHRGFHDPDEALLREARECTRGRIRRLLDAYTGPIRVIAATQRSPVDRLMSTEVLPILVDEATHRQRAVVDDARFANRKGLVLLRMVEVAGEAKN